MKKISATSPANKYGFVKGDYVLEFDQPLRLDEKVLGFLDLFFTANDVCWEVSLPVGGGNEFDSIAFYGASAETIDAEVQLFQKAFSRKAVNSYVII